MVTFIALGIAVIAIAGAGVLWSRAQRAERGIEHEQARVRFCVNSLGQRYQIKVADWGPDFTGGGGVLPRWRWVVSDADYDLKVALLPEDGPYEGPRVFMLGNSPTQQEAYIAAMAWIEQQENPVLVVDGRSL